MDLKSNVFGQVYKIGILAVKVLVVVFVIIGSVNLFKAIYKTLAFDQYPLPDWSMTIYNNDKEIKKSDEEISTARKLQKLEDYSGAISMLLVAGGLCWLAKKES